MALLGRAGMGEGCAARGIEDLVIFDLRSDCT
jgi:hypothetical protein